MASSCTKPLLSSTLNPLSFCSSSFSNSSCPLLSFHRNSDSSVSSFSHGGSIKLHDSSSTHTSLLSKKARASPLSLPISFKTHICRASEYKFPDPIPEFADSETEKFRTHLLNKLAKKDMFGDSLEDVVVICTQILSTFLHSEYGGPGTLLVLPFIDMADTINERGLPGGPQAARAAVKWAQNHIDNDWKEWTGDSD